MRFLKISAFFLTLFVIYLQQGDIFAYYGNNKFKSLDLINKPIDGATLEKIEKIKHLIKKNKSIDIIVGENELLVLIFEFFDENGDSEIKIKKPAYMILFYETEINKKGMENIAVKLIPEFLKGNNSKIKKIIWFENGNSFSWSRGNKLKKEIKCSCGCYEGIFAFQFCAHKNCPLKKAFV